MLTASWNIRPSIDSPAIAFQNCHDEPITFVVDMFPGNSQYPAVERAMGHKLPVQSLPLCFYFPWPASLYLSVLCELRISSPSHVDPVQSQDPRQAFQLVLDNNFQSLHCIMQYQLPHFWQKKPKELSLLTFIGVWVIILNCWTHEADELDKSVGCHRGTERF